MENSIGIGSGSAGSLSDLLRGTGNLTEALIEASSTEANNAVSKALVDAAHILVQVLAEMGTSYLLGGLGVPSRSPLMTMYAHDSKCTIHVSHPPIGLWMQGGRTSMAQTLPKPLMDLKYMTTTFTIRRLFRLRQLLELIYMRAKVRRCCRRESRRLFAKHLQ